MVYLDTHVVVWLYAGEHARLTRTTRRLVETESLLISPVLLLELALLEETGRIRAKAQAIFAELKESLGLSTCDLPSESLFDLQQAVDLVLQNGFALSLQGNPQMRAR